MQDDGIGEKLGVKSIKSKRDNGHGKLNFWSNGTVIGGDTWEPPDNLKNAKEAHTQVSKPPV